MPLDEQEVSNQDLEDLGLVLLDCMEEQTQKHSRTASEVREQRATNKVFGLSDPERWSGCKKLVDFLDDLFTFRRRPTTKLEKVVSLHILSFQSSCSRYCSMVT